MGDAREDAPAPPVITLDGLGKAGWAWTSTMGNIFYRLPTAADPIGHTYGRLTRPLHASRLHLSMAGARAHTHRHHPDER